MATQPAKNVADVARDLGVYPEDAFDFVREGLSRAVDRTHGPASPSQVTVAEYMAEHGLDFDELYDRFVTGKLPGEVSRAIERMGGIEKVNRHVTGQDLCWALRDIARQRWGMLARLVLARWKITRTVDFGEIVFAMIKHELMQKQPHDTLDDFADVFDFAEAFGENQQ